MDGEASVTQRLVAALDRAGVSYKHMRHEPVFTSQQAAAVRGTSLHSGAKALVVKAEDTYVLVVTPADMRLDNNALRKRLGTKRLRFASREELLELTGLVPGAVPPFGSLFGLRTLCDEHLSQSEEINFNAGSNSESLQLSYHDYIAFESPEVTCIARTADTGGRAAGEGL